MTDTGVTPLPLDALQDWGATPSPERHDLPTLGHGLGKGFLPISTAIPSYAP